MFTSPEMHGRRQRPILEQAQMWHLSYIRAMQDETGPFKLKRLGPIRRPSLAIASVLGIWLTIAEPSSVTLPIAMAYGVFGLVVAATLGSGGATGPTLESRRLHCSGRRAAARERISPWIPAQSRVTLRLGHGATSSRQHLADAGGG